MTTGTVQSIFNQRNSINYGEGTAGTGGGLTEGLVQTAELFVSEGYTGSGAVGLLAAAGTGTTSSRSTQGLVRFRGYAFADQVIKIQVQTSLDGVTFRPPDTTATGFTITAASASAAVVWDVPACAPYMNVKVTNTGGSTLTIMDIVTDLIAGS